MTGIGLALFICSVLVACDAVLWVLVRVQFQRLHAAPVVFKAMAVVVSVAFGFLGFVIPIAALGPHGIPAAAAAASLGGELGVLLVAYHVWENSFWTRQARTVLTSHPGLNRSSTIRALTFWLPRDKTKLDVRAASESSESDERHDDDLRI